MEFAHTGSFKKNAERVAGPLKCGISDRVAPCFFSYFAILAMNLDRSNGPRGVLRRVHGKNTVMHADRPKIEYPGVTRRLIR